MKTIGLLGGMKWESTGNYYRLINVGVSQKTGGSQSTKIFLGSFDFDEIERLRKGGQRADAAVLLARAAESLKGAGADYLVICANEMHTMADDIETPSCLSLLPIAEAVGETVKRKGLKRVGLLGPDFVVSNDFYRLKLAEKFDIETIVPDVEDQQMVNGIIIGELVIGVINNTSRQTCLAIAEKLIGHGIEGLIVGCPELALIIAQSDVKVPVLDTLELHAGAIVERLTA